MKNLIKIVLALAIAAFFSTSCSEDTYSLGDSYTISQDKVSFDVTPGSDVWTFNYTAFIDVDAVKYPYTYEIRFGDGSAAKNLSGMHEYIVAKGTYTAQCLVYTPNGEVVIKEKAIVIAEDNEKIHQDDPASLQYALTGGKENSEGKVWSLGPKSYMCNTANRNDIWWDYNGPDPAMMNDRMTFTPNSIKPNGGFYLDNDGDSFMNESLGNLFPDGDTAGSFVTENYTPSTTATWEITVEDGKTYLTIYKGFISYAIAPANLEKTVYEVASFTTTSIVLWYADNPIWQFELSTEEPKDVVDLTGGKNETNGKSWKLRPHANGSGIIMTRTWEDPNTVWWTVDAGAAGSDAAYDDILTFFANGKAKIDNHGDSYLNEATAGLFSDGNTDGSFVTTEYVPSDDASWSFTAIDGISYLKLNDVFPMYALNPEIMQEGLYEIVELSADLLHIKYVAGRGEWDVTWHYYLVPVE